MSTKKTGVVHTITAEQKEKMDKQADIQSRMEAGKVEIMKVVEGVQGAEKLAELIERGKKKGNLSSSELLDVLEDMNLDAEQMDKIYDTLENLGIDTVGEDYIPELPDDAEPPLEAMEEIPDEELVDPNTLVDSFNIDDPVRMYLKEIGKVNLLTSDEEIGLAQDMNAGTAAQEQLDELEKAHHDVWSVLLQVMEEGVLTDGMGRRTDFRNTVLVMTSNLGARRFGRSQRLGFASGPAAEREQLEREVIADARRTFAPEFFNRLDAALVFPPLEQGELCRIARRLLDETGKRLAGQGVKLDVEEGALALLAREGGSREYGARPLRRAVARLVEDPAADLLLSGRMKKGDTLHVIAREGTVEVSLT